MPLLIYDNIVNQGMSLRQVISYQYSTGRKAIKEAAAWINAAQRVVICDIGASLAASIPFHDRLTEMGKQVFLEDAAEYLHYRTAAADPQTVYLLISRSGDTVEIVRLLDKLKGRGAKIIGFTNVPGSALAHQADLFVNMDSCPDHLVAVQTYTATLLVLHMLAEEVAGSLDKEDVRREIEAVPDQLQSVIEKYREISPEWRKTFRKYKSVYLLARGTARASSMESALIFHEAAWYPANGLYSAGHFRHGPWEVVDGDFLGFIFAQRGPTWELDLALAADLASMGGEIKLITAEAPKVPLKGVTHWTAGLSNPYLSPILEVVPLQFFVVEFALWQGHTAGEFRVSTPITLAEKGVTFTPAT